MTRGSRSFDGSIQEMGEKEAERWFEEMRQTVEQLRQSSNWLPPSSDFVEETRSQARTALDESIRRSRKKRWLIRGLEGGAVAAALVLAIVVTLPNGHEPGQTSSVEDAEVAENMSSFRQGEMSEALSVEEEIALKTSPLLAHEPPTADEMELPEESSVQEALPILDASSFPQEKLLMISSSPPAEVKSQLQISPLGYASYLPQGFSFQHLGTRDLWYDAASGNLNQATSHMAIASFVSSLHDVMQETVREMERAGWSVVPWDKEGALHSGWNSGRQRFVNRQNEAYVYYRSAANGRVWRAEIISSEDRSDRLVYYEAILEEVKFTP